MLVENTGVCGPYCGAKGSVGTDVVQRGWEGMNWIVGGEYWSVWTDRTVGGRVLWALMYCREGGRV